MNKRKSWSYIFAALASFFRKFQLRCLFFSLGDSTSPWNLCCSPNAIDVMLKRVRSKSTPRSADERAEMTLAHAQAGDRKRACVFTTDACHILNELRKSGLLCDATLSSKRQSTEPVIEHPVHRFLLAGRRRYRQAQNGANQ